MPKDYVTITQFNREIQGLKTSHIALEKKINTSIASLRKELKVHAEKQRQIFEKNCRGFLELFMEHVDHRFAVLMEHPVFTEYEEKVNKRLKEI
jgi:hypothetical protein